MVNNAGPGRLRFFTPDSGVLLSGTYGGNAFGALDLKPFSAKAHFYPPLVVWVTYEYVTDHRVDERPNPHDYLHQGYDTNRRLAIE